jgi:hypothetical protein
VLYPHPPNAPHKIYVKVSHFFAIEWRHYIAYTLDMAEIEDHLRNFRLPSALKSLMDLWKKPSTHGFQEFNDHLLIEVEPN